MDFIDLKAQQELIRDKIDLRIKKILDHGKYIMGPEIDELEEKLTSYVGVKHCISCSSGVRPSALITSILFFTICLNPATRTV